MEDGDSNFDQPDDLLDFVPGGDDGPDDDALDSFLDGDSDEADEEAGSASAQAAADPAAAEESPVRKALAVAASLGLTCVAALLALTGDGVEFAGIWVGQSLNAGRLADPRAARTECQRVRRMRSEQAEQDEAEREEFV